MLIGLKTYFDIKDILDAGAIACICRWRTDKNGGQ